MMDGFGTLGMDQRRQQAQTKTQQDGSTGASDGAERCRVGHGRRASDM